jgi:hypothetical protein
MPAFNGKADLRSAIRQYQEWDAGMSDAQIDLSIALCEEMINGDLMQPPASGSQGGVNRMLTMVGGLFTAGSRTVSLPPDFLGVKSFRYTTAAGDEATVNYFAPDGLFSGYGGAATGAPAGYTVVNDQILLGPTPDSQYSYTLIYFAAVPPLITDTDTNWVLAKFPTAYLFGSLMQNSVYLMDDARVQGVIAPGYNLALQRMRLDSNRAAFPSSNLAISIQGATP